MHDVHKKSLTTLSSPSYGMQGLISLLNGLGILHAVEKNQVVLQEKERLSTVLVIVSGVVKVRSVQADGHEEVLGLLGGGECIGIASVIGAQQAWGDVVSITPSQVLRLPKEEVVALILEQPSAALHFMAMMAGSLRTVRERVMARHHQPPERVLGTLIELAHKANPDALETDPLIAPGISQAELASLTGVARETCCRCMNKLQRKGLLWRTEAGWMIRTTREPV